MFIMKGGRIPAYQNNFFAFDGNYNVIFKENFIYKTANENRNLCFYLVVKLRNE